MRVPDSDARIWYIEEAAREGWSVRQLERNINSFYYQRQIQIGAHNNCSSHDVAKIDARQFVKDPYVELLLI